MKRIAQIVLHYGKEYLPWAIRSVQGSVQEIHVFYSPRPSHGHEGTEPCPETESELRKAAETFLTRPLFWHTGNWAHEGEQREAVWGVAADRKADLVLVLDADEIWEPDCLERSLLTAAELPAKRLRVRFIHFWRSFGWVCRDPAMPIRILRPGGQAEGYLPSECQVFPVFHFGYAQGSPIVRYKMSIHGHKNEVREGWFREKFEAWRPGPGSPGDVHPTCLDNFWTPEPLPEDLRTAVESVLSDHPNFGKGFIP